MWVRLKILVCVRRRSPCWCGPRHWCVFGGRTFGFMVVGIKAAVLIELMAMGLSTLVMFIVLKAAALVELIAVGLKAHGRRAHGCGAG